MKRAMIDHLGMLAAMFLVVVLLATEASAQFSTGQLKRRQLPDVGAQQSGGQMTPDQIRELYWLRALQSRGGNRGVRTGYPQFVPFGPTGLMGFPTFPNSNVQPQATGKTSAQKRADARAARAEKNRIAREKAEAKKAAAEKAKAEARAKAKNKQKDPA